MKMLTYKNKSVPHQVDLDRLLLTILIPASLTEA